MKDLFKTIVKKVDGTHTEVYTTYVEAEKFAEKHCYDFIQINDGTIFLSEMKIEHRSWYPTGED